MCRLFGLISSPLRTHATFWLLDAPDSLVAQSHREPDGVGMGWFDADEPRVYKRPIAAFEDRRFAREARERESPTFVSHVRFASTGRLTDANTHPFCQDGRLFAHNGVIEDLPALDRRLGAARSRVRGDTDSERFFALISAEIERCGGDVGAGIASATTWIAGHLPVLSLNFVLVTEHELWALRYPATHSLFLLQRPARGTELEHQSSLGTRVRSEHARSQPLAVVASERMDGDPGWRELRSGELIHVGPTLDVQTQLAFPQAPAQPLSLTDLDARARASQTHPPAS